MARTSRDKVMSFRRQAEGYVRQGQSLKAANCWRKALALAESLPDRERADLHCRLAESLENQRDDTGAIEQYRRCLDIAGTASGSGVCQAVGYLYRRNRSWADALHYLERALSYPDCPNRRDVYYAMAGAFRGMGKYEEALACFAESEANDGMRADWEIERSRGITYLASGNAGLALECFESALSSGECDIPGNVYIHMGDACRDMGRLKEAEHYYELTAKDTMPDTSGSGHIRLGQIYEDGRKYIKAMMEYQLAERKFREAEALGISSPDTARQKLEQIQLTIALLQRGRILDCYKVNEECPHFATKPAEVTVFVAMPFGTDINKIAFDSVYTQGIAPVINSLGIHSLRGDSHADQHDVMCTVCLAIQHALVVIADCTGRNANVFYETGLAHALQKRVILITQNLADVPFDLKPLRCIEYHDVDGLRQALESQLRRALQDLSRQPEAESPRGHKRGGDRSRSTPSAI